MFNDTLSQRALQAKWPVISQVTAKLFALCNLHTCLFVCQIYSFPISSGIWLEHDSSNTKHVSIKSTLPALIEECRNRRLEGLDFKTKAFQIGRRAHTLSSGGGRKMASLRLTHLASETLSWNRSENKIKKKKQKTILAKEEREKKLAFIKNLLQVPSTKRCAFPILRRVQGHWCCPCVTHCVLEIWD